MPLTMQLLRRSGEKSREGTTYTDTYQVLAPAEYSAALVLDDMPTLGQEYSGDAGAVLTRVLPRLQNTEVMPAVGSGGDLVRWEVDLVFSPRTMSVPDENPLLEWPKIRFSFATYERVAEKDINGNAILNSAKDPFDPPLMQEERDIIINIERNVAAYNPVTALEFIDSVNSAQITVAGVTIAAEAGKLEDWTATPATRGSTNYYQEHIAIRITRRAEKWKRRVLDQGLRELKDGGKVRIRDSKKQFVTEPWRLNGSGVALAADAAAGTPPSVFLDKETREKKAWSTMNLPATVFKP